MPAENATVATTAPENPEHSAPQGGHPRSLTRTLFGIWTWLEVTVVAAVTFFIAAGVKALTWPFDRRGLLPGHIVRIGSAMTVKLN